MHHDTNGLIIYLILAHARRARYCDERICMSVCLPAGISQKPHVWSSDFFVLSGAVARSSSDDNGTRYMYFSWQYRREGCSGQWTQRSNAFPGWAALLTLSSCAHRGRSLLSKIALLLKHDKTTDMMNILSCFININKQYTATLCCIQFWTIQWRFLMKRSRVCKPTINPTRMCKVTPTPQICKLDT